MKIFFPAVNFNKINNFNLNFKGKPKTKDYNDSFLAQYEGYSYRQQAEIIKNFDGKLRAIRDEIDELINLKGNNKARIMALKKEALLISSKKAEALKEFNKNVRILYDKKARKDMVKSYLLVHKEIVPIAFLHKSEDEDVGRLWRNGDFFVVNDTPFGAFIDSSYELNKENYKILSDKGVCTYHDIKEKYGLDFNEIKMYLQNGYFRPLTLKKIGTDDEIPTRLINMNDKYNLEGIERYNNSLKPSKLSPFINDSNLSAEDLSTFGFGDEKTLIRAVEKGKIRGQIKYIKTENGIIPKAEISFNEPATKTVLKQMRANNSSILSARKVLQMTGISKLELENAVRSREIEPINYCIYPEDENKIFLDIKKPENVDFIYKKIIERSIIKGAIDENIPAIVKLTFELCYKTKSTGNKLLIKYPGLKAIVNKQKRQSLSCADVMQLEEFSKALWEPEEVDEFHQVRARVKTSVKEHKNKGISGIKDDEIRDFLTKKAFES